MEKVKIIGYGSLISKESLKRTIKTHSNFKEVLVHGYKRVFDLKSAKQMYEPWDTDVAVLNVEKSKNARFNGVVYEVSLNEFHKLLEREKTYRIIKVKYSDYKTDKAEGEAFLFLGLEQYVHPNLNPHTHYFHVCRKGAYSISDEYGLDWDRTTYLANGKKVSELGDHLVRLNKYHKLKDLYPGKG